VSLLKAEDPFGWKEMPEVRLQDTIGRPGFSYLSAVWQARAAHVGVFESERTVFFLADRFWIIKDLVTLEKSAALRWRFTTPFRVRRDHDSALIEGQGSILLMMPFASDPDSLELSVEDTWISEDYLSQNEAQALTAASAIAARHEVVWLAMPMFAEQEPPRDAQLTRLPAGLCFRFTDLEGEHRICFGLSPEDEERELVTDGSFSYLLQSDDICRRLIVCRGRIARLRSHVLLETRAATEYLDMRLTERGYQIDAAPGTELLTPSANDIIS
jgi:hypothetical protein